MNLFWKKILRQLQTTKKFEKIIDKIQAKTESTISNNMENMTIQQLETYLRTPLFTQNKKKYIKTKYKNTDEYKLIRKYEKLHNNPKIKQYYETINLPLLKTYIDFKTNPETLKLSNQSLTEMSQQIEKLKKFENSDIYKNYTTLHNSLTIREYEEIENKINNPEFIKKNKFWKNPNRWQLTHEYQIEQQYLKLTRKTTTKDKKTNLFETPQHIQSIWEETFEGKQIDATKWKDEFYKKNQKPIGNYSFADEHQANNGTNNITLQDNQCTIHTKYQPIKALAWDVQKGFNEKNFDYTAAILQNGHIFQQKYGIFSIKIKCEGMVHHSIWLKGENKLPHINIFHTDGKKITVGNATQHRYISQKIKGIDKSKYYIYTLEWTPNTLTWYVNNVEIFKTQQYVPNQKLYIGINSFLPKANPPAEGKLTIDWIKVFTTKNQ